MISDAAADLTTAELAEIFAAALLVAGDSGATDDARNAAYVTCEAVNAETYRREDVAQARVELLAGFYFSTAIDQAPDYPSIEVAIDEHREFADRQAKADGLDRYAVGCAYDNLADAARAL